jgi:hypothetical protein
LDLSLKCARYVKREYTGRNKLPENHTTKSGFSSQATKEAEHREKLSDLRARVDACKERYNLENNAYHKAQVITLSHRFLSTLKFCAGQRGYGTCMNKSSQIDSNELCSLTFSMLNCH